MLTSLRFHRSMLLTLICLLFISVPFAAPFVAVQAAGICRVGTNHATIQAALDDANCATIEVGAGTFTEHLTVGRSVSLVGTIGQTVLDGSNTGTVVTIAAGANAIIAGVTIQRGDGKLNGVAVRNLGTLTLRDSRIQNNTPLSGTDNQFPKVVYNAGSLIIEQTTINNNTAPSTVGAIVFSSGTLTIRDSTISQNKGTGLVIQSQATPTNAVTLTNVTIAQNTSNGLTTTGSPIITMRNVTIAENQNGLINTDGLITATNTTIVANKSNSSDSRQVRNSGTITFTNSLIALRYESEGPFPVCNGYGSSIPSGTIISNGHNIETGSTCDFTTPTDRQNSQPKLIALKNNGGLVLTVALRPGSVAIDNGDSAACPRPTRAVWFALQMVLAILERMNSKVVQLLPRLRRTMPGITAPA